MFKWLDDTKTHTSFLLFGAIFGAAQTANQYDWARTDGDYGPLWTSVPVLAMFCFGLVNSSKRMLEEVLDSRDKLRLDSSHQPNND